MKMTESMSGLSSNRIEDITSSNKIPFDIDHVTLREKSVCDSDDNELTFTRIKTKMNKFEESDSDTDKENNIKLNTVSSPLKSASENDSDEEIFINKKKSRIRHISNSDNESQADHVQLSSTNSYDLTRSKIKNKMLHDKFKKLKNPGKSVFEEKTDKPHVTSDDDDEKSANHSDNSDDENSCIKIKQNLKKSSHSLASICDPDTSDEEGNINVKQQKSRPKKTKVISPKAVRMSAKQAMENMQKIKSESNRMLREKEVSLPYHRPKALTLKDIMNRRRPAVTSDGKSLPLKMNNEQLKQYASLLEERQKEMMELCKSDTEEEDSNCSKEEVSGENSLTASTIPLNLEETASTETNNIDQNSAASSDINNKAHNDICMEQIINESKTDSVEEQNTEQPTIVNVTVNDTEIPNGNTETVTVNLTENKETHVLGADSIQNEPLKSNNNLQGTEDESQLIALHYDDTDKTEVNVANDSNKSLEAIEDLSKESLNRNDEKEDLSDQFSDNDFAMEDLDMIIAKAEANKDKPFSYIETLGVKPKLTGVPGMIIDLDGGESSTQKKLTGVELLKERFTYFAKLKTLEESEKDREKKFKPGIQHLKLKQELEEQIAEQRSLEWEKRLEEENKLKSEMNEVGKGEEFDGEDIEKMEAKLEDTDNIEAESSSEEELDDVDMTDKPRKRNPMVDDEAEVSEDEANENAIDDVDNEDGNDNNENDIEEIDNKHQNSNSGDGEDSDSESDVDSSESEQDEEQTKPRKGRILKAFEDSDDEESKVDPNDTSKSEKQVIQESQVTDDDIQLAQPQRFYSEELYTSADCSQKSSKSLDKPKDTQFNTSFQNDLGSQTFSILESGCDNLSSAEHFDRVENNIPEKLDVIYETQPSSINLEGIVGMCTGNFVDNLVSPQDLKSQLTPSLEIGDEVAAMCTGKFYDNPLISQPDLANENNENNTDDSMNMETPETLSNEVNIKNTADKSTLEVTTATVAEKQSKDVNVPENLEESGKKVNETDNKLLKSILDELDDPDFDLPKPNKYFLGGNKNKNGQTDKTDKLQTVENAQLKKKFVIESDDEGNDNTEVTRTKKKLKKRKLQDRALQISDDEDEYSEQEEETYASDLEEDNDRLVEYDSEENEVEIQVKPTKKKHVGKGFFEQEAELTSEDEWVGSGDEDEAGLDRMEREAGDDEVFHQGKLQRELGEIHMREVLDQDKREVRLIQELLFEDGDLGDGHRQRKFRWKNADGDEEMGTNVDEYADTQEDEFESEEQWRKQRHEREMFLRKLQEKDDEEASISINRSALIKANLSSKPTTSAAEKIPTDTENMTSPELQKKSIKDIPSPKKPFTIFQQNYHNSLLTRGRGALARLAALATPLVGDGDDTPKVNASSTRGNFVFAAITPDAEPKVSKRKADANPDTPRLLKKIKKQDSNKYSKSSLLDHL